MAEDPSGTSYGGVDTSAGEWNELLKYSGASAVSGRPLYDNLLTRYKKLVPCQPISDSGLIVKVTRTNSLVEVSARLCAVELLYLLEWCSGLCDERV